MTQLFLLFEYLAGFSRKHIIMRTLDKAKVGDNVKIVGFVGEDDRIFRRFLELGLLRGQVVKVHNMSILKKVVLLEVRGYVLSVRRSLLERVVVE